MLLKKLEETARSCGCRVEEAEPMAAHTSFKIGGPADLYIEAPNGLAAAAVVKLCRESGIPLLLIGNGSNMLVGDGGVRGAGLRLSGGDAAPGVMGKTADGGVLVACPAGLSLKRLCLFARENGLSGLEFAYGIPATVGGAVFMNAGAYGGEMRDVLQSAEAFLPDGTAVDIPAENMKLSYRHSVFMENGGVVTAAVVALHPDDAEAVGGRMEEFLRRRKEKQPLEYPSAGSFFKRPPGHFAGTLIEKSGLKGCRIGGAQVSEKHAGFLINRGGATCEDVRRLAVHVQETVLTRHGVRLEPEVRFVGEP